MTKRPAIESALAEYLDDIERGLATPEECLARDPARAAELEPLLRLVLTLKNVPNPVPEQAFRRNARIRILNQVGSARPPVHVPSRRDRLTQGLMRALSGAALLIVFIIAGGLFTFTTQNTLPGDALYPVKMALEEAQLLAVPPAEEAVLASRFASARLTEIQLLIVQGRFEDVEAGVDRFEADIDRALIALAALARSDGAPVYPFLVEIERDMNGYADTLEQMRAFVPQETRLVLARAIEASRLWSGGSDL